MTAVEGVKAISQSGVPGGGGATGRVVVAGAAPLTDVVRRAISRVDASVRVEGVEGFLHAIGETSRGAPLAFVGAVSLLRGEAAQTAAALRRAAPEARLVLIARSDESLAALHALSDGFDDFLIEPFDAEQLARAIRLPPRRADDAAPSPALVTPIAPPPSVPAPPAPAEATVEADTDSVPENRPAEPSAPVARPATPEAVAPPPSPADAALGDVDLIEQLIRHHGGVTDMAVRIVSQEAGIAGAAWSPSQNDVPAGHAAAQVTYRKHALGVLHAPPPATAEQLAPWASWLAHWLAIDRRMGELWESATRDELTRVWNRRYFNQFLTMILDRAATERFRVTLLLFDIDNFKQYNDRYGHGAGDEILRETARLMQSVVRTHDVVARFGGDEFAVIFWDAEAPRQPNSQHPPDAMAAARRFQRAICDHRFPKLLEEAPGTLTISGGLASFPWDGRTPEQLVELADTRLLQSKRQGKNAITFGPGAADVCRIG